MELSAVGSMSTRRRREFRRLLSPVGLLLFDSTAHWDQPAMMQGSSPVYMTAPALLPDRSRVGPGLLGIRKRKVSRGVLFFKGCVRRERGLPNNEQVPAGGRRVLGSIRQPLSSAVASREERLPEPKLF